MDTRPDGRYRKVARAFNRDRGDAGALRSDLANDPATAGLRVDRALSTVDHAVLVSRRKNEIIIALQHPVAPRLGVHEHAQRDGSLGALTRVVNQKYGPLGFNHTEVVGTGPHGGMVAFTVGADGTVSNPRVDEESDSVTAPSPSSSSSNRIRTNRRTEIHHHARAPPVHEALSLRPEKRPKITLQAEAYRTTKRPGDMRYYGVVSQAAYMDGDESKYAPLFREHGMDGLVLDKDLSSKKNSVFYDQGTGQVVISYRGTDPSDSEDLWDDFLIATGFESRASRFKKAEKLYQTAAAKYGKENITITGHSLGGEIAMTVAERHDVEAHVFSPGMELAKAFQSHKGNANHTYVYYTRHDPVPMVVPYSMDSNRITRIVPQSNTWNPHAIDNFIEDKTHKTTGDLFDLPEKAGAFAIGKAYSALGDLMSEVAGEFDDMIGEEFGPEAKEASEFFRETVVPAYVQSSTERAQELAEMDIKGPKPKDDAERVARALDYDIGFGF